MVMTTSVPCCTTCAVPVGPCLFGGNSVTVPAAGAAGAAGCCIGGCGGCCAGCIGCCWAHAGVALASTMANAQANVEILMSAILPTYYVYLARRSIAPLAV